VGTQPQFVATPNVGVAQITNGTATTAETVFTAGSSGSKVTALSLSSTDTTARVVQVALVRSSTSYILGTVTVPITAGTDGVTASVDAISQGLLPGLPLDNDGQHYLLLDSGDTLTIVPTATITSAKIISGVAIGGNF
jgi:hypothetical protein